MSVTELLQRAVGHHQAGQLDAAEAIYLQVLRTNPNQPDACHLLGVLLGQRGRAAEGIECIRRAINASPNEASFHNNLGNLLRETGERPAAIAAFERALQLRPDYFEAHNNLGNALQDAKRYSDAIAAYRRAIELNPADARLKTNLGICLLAAGQIDAALTAHRAALEQNPNQPAAWTALGAALLRASQASSAVTALERAIVLRPEDSASYVNLAAALREAGDLNRAAAVCAQALQIHPDAATAHNTMANILADQGQTAASIEHSRRAIALQPDYAEAYMNLGIGLVERRDVAAALPMFEKAIELEPDLAEAHRNYGMALLTLGDFARGFTEYEWRWKSPWFRGHACNVTLPAAPRWRGEPIAGKTILLHAEQGLGDTIQFSRYVPMVMERGAKVILQCPASLVRLIKSLTGVTQVIATIDETTGFDFHCPLMSLPTALNPLNANDRSGPLSLGTSGKRVRVRGSFSQNPSSGPSRKAPLTQTLSPEYGGKGTRLARVGLAWAGNPKLRTDRNRSIPLAQLAPLFTAAANAKWFSLQLGPAAEQLQAPLIDLRDRITDFADTAVLVEQLDLVITVDTAVAHLAGTLGVPTWVMIPRIADWRWQLDRTDSPWYPSMRLFRQQMTGDWTDVIDSVAEALRRF